MRVQGGRGHLQMWLMCLVLTACALSGSVADEEMCYKVSPFKTRADWAKIQCYTFGSHLMRVRNQEDVWTVGNITRGIVTDTHVRVGGSYSSGKWKYYDGTEITWTENWQSNGGNRIMMDIVTGLWVGISRSKFLHYICERHRVIGNSTNGLCFQPAPAVDGASKTENATHVVYTCHPGYEFADQNTTKVWECACAALANIDPCLPMSVKANNTCFVRLYGHNYRPSPLRQLCRHSNASLPQVFNQRENDALQQKMIDKGFGYCYLDVHSDGFYRFTQGINEVQINYTNFESNPRYNSAYRFISMAANTGFWIPIPYTRVDYDPFCEMTKELVAGGCSTGRPTFPHSTIADQNQTHVTYSCATNYAFPDGTLQKTVECGCENAMLVHGCHLVERQSCLQPVRILLNVSQAEQFCNTAGGTLAKIINNEEMEQVQPTPYKREYWTSGKRYDGLWTWGDDTRIMYKKWYSGHPQGEEPVHVRRAVLHTTGYFLDISSFQVSRYFVCETEPAVTCPETIPTVPHSSATTDGTHVTYTCDNHYTFDDGSSVKAVRCNCGEITKLAGCHRTSRNVCFVSTPMKENATAAKTYCESFGASQAKVLSEEERDSLSSLMFPFAINGWLGGLFDRSEGVWRWNDGTFVVWEQWHSSIPDFTGQSDYDYVHLRLDQTFYNSIHPAQSSTIFCEREYDPSVPCGANPPAIAHGTVSDTNTTHVTYRCDDNYAFSDGEPERSFPCGCEVLGNVSACLLSGRAVYYFRTAYETKHSLGTTLCKMYGGALPRTYTIEEHRTLQSLVFDGHYAHLEGYRNLSTWHWMLAAGERIVWNLFPNLHPAAPHSQQNHLAVDNFRDMWHFLWERARRQLLCEKVRNPEVTCDTEEPPVVQDATFTHNGTYVNYTCVDRHAFLYGEPFMIYPCDVASLAPLYPCHMNVKRDVCLASINSWAGRVAATGYCNRINGTVIKIMNAAEQQRAADIVIGNTWIQGSKYESDGVWQYDDGTMVIYDNLPLNMNEDIQPFHLYMSPTKSWWEGSGNHGFYFACEKEADPSMTCTSPPPTMPYADMTYNETHVNYTCHPGAAFYDETTTKIYTCSCASFKVNQACIQNARKVCFAPTKVARSFKQQAATCRHFNLTLGKILNHDELTTALAIMNGFGELDYLIGASSIDVSGMYIYTDGTPLTWRYWYGNFRPHNENAVRIHNIGYMVEQSVWYSTKGLCAAEGAYTCEDAPEVQNAERNVTASEVIYTCKPDHTFSDGETQKTYSCLCAQTAALENCKSESRPVCIAKAVTHSTYHPTARAICQSRNAELPRIINDADVARFQQLGLFYASVDGDNANPDMIFKYSDGEIIQWTAHNSEGQYLTEYSSDLQVLKMNPDWKYKRTTTNVRLVVVCEVPKDETCTQTPPTVQHATFVSNSTHVTYRCEKGYKFMDHLTEKVYPCDCVNTATIDPCRGPRRVCFVQSEFWLNQDRAEYFCNKHGGHLAKIDSDEEVHLMLAARRATCFLSGNDRKRNGDFRWHDDSPVEYTWWGDNKRYLDTDAFELKHNARIYHRYSYHSQWFLCEKELPKASCAVPEQQRTGQNFDTEADCEENNYCWQVPTSGSVPSCFDPIIPAGMPTNEELCGTPPSIAHGTCVNVNDVITCTCDSDAQYFDGTNQRTYSCDCASMASIQFCALKTRAELCLVESPLKRPYTQARAHCEEYGGRLPVSYTLTEHTQLRDMSIGDTLWLDGSDKEEEQIWKFNSTGELVVWQNFWPVPSNTSRNNLIYNRAIDKWMDASADEVHGFVCEAIPDVECTSSAPDVKNADRTLTASTVTYRCHEGYTFFDGTQEKTYNCQCYGLLTVLHCKVVAKNIFVSSYQTTYGDGEDTCEHLGGTLVQVNDEPTRNTTLQVLDKWKVSSAWISSKSTEDFSFAGVDCITIDTDSQWSDTSCTDKHHFLCELANDAERLPWRVKSRLTCWNYNALLWGVPDDLAPAPCERPSVYFTPGSTQTWTAAKDTCSGLGGNLARATNNNEARMMAAFSKRYMLPKAWVDGDDKSGGMRWSTRKAIVTPPVATLTSDDADSLQCLQAEGVMWTDGDCNTQQHFICEKKISPDWPDSNYCTWKEDLTQTWADAQATCQQFNADIAWADNARDLANLVNDSVDEMIWLGAKEETSEVWKLPSGDPISWSLWAEDGQNTGQLGCMVYDGQSRRIREHPCNATDVTSFFCRRSDLKTPSKMTLRNQELGCGSGYGFADGSRKLVLNSSIDCKTLNSTVDPGDQYSTCYPTNNFMMKHLGNYGMEDEYALADESLKTCTDLVKIWSKGPKIANFRKVWKCASPFLVTIVTNDELSNLVTDNGEKKIGIRVEVNRDSPWEDDTYGSSRQFTMCTKVTVVTYRCPCLSDDEPCSVFVSVTVRDPSVLTNVGSLKLCHIAMTAVN